MLSFLPFKFQTYDRVLKGIILLSNQLLKPRNMDKEEIIKRIAINNTRGKELIQFIEQQIPILHKANLENQKQKLVDEIIMKNMQLKENLELWKRRLIELEIMNGIEQHPLLEKEAKAVNNNDGTNKPVEVNVSIPITSDTKSENSTQSKKKAIAEDKTVKKIKAAKSEKPDSDENKDISVSRLDLRIGRILSAKKHPDAESLYVEEIDVGEDKPRTVVSGLVKFVPLEDMQNRLVVTLCNLKPAKMRGITSEAMVMCASTPDKVEILCPPANSIPGDRVICDEYPGVPDSMLPPKKKIFEQVAPDLKTNSDCVATYKSAPLKVSTKGVIKSLTLTDVQIK